MGDINLDFLRWSQPEPGVHKMVEKVKDEIETIGFSQIVEEKTRSWRNQPDLCLNHIWTNSPGRLVFYKNIERAFSDHNLILLSFRSKGGQNDRHDIITRDRKNYKIDWTQLLQSENIDIINYIFSTEILKILDKMAPLKTFQKIFFFKVAR